MSQAQPTADGKALDELLRVPREDGDHPALGRLALLQSGELSDADATELRRHIDGCPSCQEQLEALDAERAAFLERRPFSALETALVARRRETEAQSEGAGFWAWLRRAFPIVVPALGVAAAASVVALLWLAPTPHPGEAGKHGGTRLKAATALSFAVRGSAGVEEGEPGGRYRAGDQIQLRYSSPRPGYLLVVSLDGRGAVTPFYDDDGRSLAIEAGSGQLLEGSVILDDARGPERILGCFSEERLETAAVLGAARAALEEAGGDPRAVASLPLACEQAGFVIIKE